MARPTTARKKKKAALQLVATCSAGLEELVADEIRTQSGRVTDGRTGAVAWEGSLASGYGMCLWSRFASRILVRIASFEAEDPDTLYRRAGKIDWEEHFSGRSTFAVYCTSQDSPINHSKFAALRIKDAIVDQFRARRGRRPDVDPVQPAMRFHLHLHRKLATISVDLSGDSLHRRGYRLTGVEAPLKETLAAGIVRLAGFAPDFPADAVLIDPMCGSGTLLIEAAMLFGDSAPGLQRKRFGFEAWNRHDRKLWEKLVSEAVQREEQGLQRPWPQMIGHDADPQAVHAARKNIEAAGLEDKIMVSQRQFAFLGNPGPAGMLLINPPYGERLSDREEVKYLYRCIGRKLREEVPGWRLGLFSANPDLIGSLKMEWADSFRLFNGPIRCGLHTGIVPQSTEHAGFEFIPTPPDQDMEGADLAECLLQNYQATLPWRRQENITCFRLYDADIAAYNFTVDIYDEWLHVTQHASPPGRDLKEAQHLFNTGLAVIRQTFRLPPSRLFIRTAGQTGKRPDPAAKKKKVKLFEVREDACRFLVNLTGERNLGLSIALRSVRRMIGPLAGGKSFLNLFGECGSATVHAMMNNSAATTTVIESGAEMQRARANFALNGFGGPQHATIQQAPGQWLARSRDRYSLILAVPPKKPFSRQEKNSSGAADDHLQLVRLAMQRLARDGLFIFLSSTPAFNPADELDDEFAVQEITAAIIPEDFRKHTFNYRCWEFRHRSAEE